MDRPSKTLALVPGLAKSRTKSPPIGLQTLIDRIKMSKFVETVKTSVSDDEALEAAKFLTRSGRGRVRRYAEGGAVGGTLSPGVAFSGNLAESVAAHGPTRKALGEAAAKTFAKPALAKTVVQGALGGGVIQAVREGVELGKAKRTVRDFLDQHRKHSGVEPAPQSRGIPRRKPTDPWRYDPRPAGEF